MPKTYYFGSPKSTRRPGDAADWSGVDAVIYFWVRASRISSGLDARLLAALREWAAGEWAFARTVFVTNEQFAQQVRLFDGAGLRVRFELREPGKTGTYLLYG